MKTDKFKITNVARISAADTPAPGTAIVVVDYQEMRDYLIREEFYKLKGNAWQNAVILRVDQLILEKNEILGHRREVILRAELPMVSYQRILIKNLKISVSSVSSVVN